MATPELVVRYYMGFSLLLVDLCVIYKLICAIWLPAQIGYLYTHVDYYDKSIQNSVE